MERDYKTDKQVQHLEKNNMKIYKKLQNQKMEFQQKMDLYMYIVGWIFLGIFLGYLLLSKITGFEITKYEPPCIFHLLTGYYCPGCGGTRSIILFMQGHFWKSFVYYPLVPYTVGIGGIFMIRQTITFATKGKVKPMHMKTAYIMIALGILILNFVIKNICLYYGIDLLPVL